LTATVSTSRSAAPREARAARGELEALLGVRASEWPWTRRLSLWLDALLLVLEEAA
jgi:hypothetical protein